ncbi:MAG: hypothetical protein EPO65_06690 [Dehalococcoidia bacterium]|nr:MAG: hypothetical protein EPO65_06690 [Dehalococcoidia bacterium]
MHYQPPRTLGLMMGGVLVAWALAVAALLAVFAQGRNTDVATVGAWIGAGGAATLAALFAYWTMALASLRYTVDRNGLVIAWAGIRQVVPLQAIERLVPGTSLEVPRVRGISWFGYHIGSAEIRRIGSVLFYSTHQAPEQVLYVMTSERNYAISVPDPAAFAREIQVRQDLGPTAEVVHHVERTLPTLQGFWRDGRALGLLGACAALCVVNAIALGLRYGSLPELLPFAFPPGDPQPLADAAARTRLIDIPRAAAAALGIDVVLALAFALWDRVASYTVLLAGVGVQVALLAALGVALARAA